MSSHPTRAGFENKAGYTANRCGYRGAGAAMMAAMLAFSGHCKYSDHFIQQISTIFAIMGWTEDSSKNPLFPYLFYVAEYRDSSRRRKVSQDPFE